MSEGYGHVRRRGSGAALAFSLASLLALRKRLASWNVPLLALRLGLRIGHPRKCGTKVHVPASTFNWAALLVLCVIE